ncbi:MAG: AAA family ATPase [Patescibacteria group bacterium]
MSRVQIIIGLVGLPGAGKTSVADYLEKKGFIRITLSDLIKEEAGKKGIQEFSREILQALGNKMRERYGPAVLARRAFAKIKKNGIKRAVIDGIRNTHEITFLKGRDHFILLGLTAPLRVRYERLVAAKGKDWTGSFRRFQQQETREESLGKKETGLRVKECLEKASYKIKNRGDLSDLYVAVDRLLKKYLKE